MRVQGRAQACPVQLRLSLVTQGMTYNAASPLPATLIFCAFGTDLHLQVVLVRTAFVGHA